MTDHCTQPPLGRKDAPHQQAAFLLQYLVSAVWRFGQGRGVHASGCHRAGHSSCLGAQIPPHQEAGCAGGDVIAAYMASLQSIRESSSAPQLPDGAVADATPSPLQHSARSGNQMLQRFDSIFASWCSSTLHAQLLSWPKVLSCNRLHPCYLGKYSFTLGRRALAASADEAGKTRQQLVVCHGCRAEPDAHKSPYPCRCICLSGCKWLCSRSPQGAPLSSTA